MVKQNKILLYRACIVILLFSVSVFTSGCEPLRKKFIRKKKKDRENKEFVPVLEPVDYPAKIVTSEGIYSHHLNLWKVWYKDIVTAFEEKASDKRKKYLFSQMVLQLEEMYKVVSDVKRVELSKHLKKMNEFKDQMDMPSQVRNDSTIIMRVGRIDKEIRNNFNLKDMQENFR